MKLELAKYKACICEGAAEHAIMDILLDNNLLIFAREELLDESIIRCRSGEEFERKYLRKEFDGKVSVVRILDSRRENFRISKPYRYKIDVVNIVTAPEIEMLIICGEDQYAQYKRSNRKPSEYCKAVLHMQHVKSYDYVRAYFSNPAVLVRAIRQYGQNTQKRPDEWMLLDLLKE